METIKITMDVNAVEFYDGKNKVTPNAGKVIANSARVNGRVEFGVTGAPVSERCYASAFVDAGTWNRAINGIPSKIGAFVRVIAKGTIRPAIPGKTYREYDVENIVLVKVLVDEEVREIYLAEGIADEPIPVMVQPVKSRAVLG